MKRIAVAALILGLAACESAGPITIPGLTKAPSSASDALESYYRTLPDDFYPVAPEGKPLPDASTAITRVLVGSCIQEENEIAPAMSRIAEEPADVFLLIGDNVYGDRDGRAYVSNDADLEELRESFSDLAAREDFQAVRAAHPMMVAWDDHDYGANDAGKEFPFRRLAERIHERFWGLNTQDVGAWPGTYYSRSFGPDGQRTQIIMLDTRFFRTALTPTDEWGAAGKERYLPSADPKQDMLGTDQWTWLENELQKPADLRLVVSSIQVLPTDGHGWEAWSRLPQERQQLLNLVGAANGGKAMFVSGDRHAAYLYDSADAIMGGVQELTSSSINASFSESTDERDTAQVGAGYSLENFGAIDIDWDAGTVSLAIHSSAGAKVRGHSVKFR